MEELNFLSQGGLRTYSELLKIYIDKKVGDGVDRITDEEIELLFQKEEIDEELPDKFNTVVYNVDEDEGIVYIVNPGEYEDWYELEKDVNKLYKGYKVGIDLGNTEVN